MSSYDVLQVSSTATEEEIRMAYKTMVRGVPLFSNLEAWNKFLFWMYCFFLVVVLHVGEAVASG